MVADWDRHRFSEAGDSGAFVYDKDAYVAGMIWGGQSTFCTYATPIEAVLKDVESICGATDVRLVVRAEEERNKEVS